DIAAFDVHGVEYAGAQADPLAALLFCGIDHRADWTIVHGRVAVEHGEVVGLDEDRLARDANRAAARLLAGS
ncbi:MAG: 8-oxoguanine deaminase, partial [Spirochaetota bacterium]